MISPWDGQRFWGGLFAAALGLLGWGALGYGLWAQAADWPSGLSFWLFLVLVLCARSLAIPLTKSTVVSLDAGFYLASATCLGPVPGGVLVAVALTTDSFWRAVMRRGPSLSGVCNALYFGGMSGALLMGLAHWLGLSALRDTAAVSDTEVVTQVVVVGLVFLLLHYTLRGVRLWLSGHALPEYIRRAAVPGIAAEVSLLPLAVVIVFLYDPGAPLRLGVLGTLFLICNYGFNRIYATSAALKLRVAELETLGATSRRLTHSLQSTELVQIVAKETLEAIADAERLTLAWSQSLGQPEAEQGEEPWTVACFQRDGSTGSIGADDGQTAARDWVREKRAPLCLTDRERPGLGVELGPESDARSWLGVPLEIHDEVLGVLAIDSLRANAFGPHEVRLLRAIGTQAGVALQNARLYELAMVDGLTKLFVRRYFDARLEEEVHRSLRFGTEFSVVMVDIDDFKRLNDTYGHQVGDQLLAGFAEVVGRQLRGVDTAARYGGEEFAIILPRTTLVDALSLAERIRVAVADFQVEIDGRAVGTTASFGIAAYPESGVRTGPALVRRADEALYRAKRSGKNRVELSWPKETGDPTGPELNKRAS